MDTAEKLKEIEAEMQSPHFWVDKDRAQKIIAEYHDLKDEAEGKEKYDRGGAVMTIFAGAGGLDAEDFAHILATMYWRYLDSRGWEYRILHKNENDHGGYRNLTFEIDGKNVYGTLKMESGVHRLVRISPFNAKEQRHTSFAMVEVVPKFDAVRDEPIPEEELDIQFARSSGPGGQNVNKRETAVRIVHTPTNLSVHVDGERSQSSNREKALSILRGKLYRFKQEMQAREAAGLSVSKTTDAEWGNQIRSYVLHPYKLVKDHRTNVEVRTIDEVFEGHIEPFLPQT